jgi:hypothetical protein
MRINEFTDAKEQLALLRLIVDNTWTAIAQQAKAQEAQKAAVNTPAKSVKKSPKVALNVAANLGVKAKQNAVQQQHQVKQPVQQLQAVPRQQSQPRPLSNTIKPVSTTQNMSTANNPNMQPQITPAPLKK